MVRILVVSKAAQFLTGMELIGMSSHQMVKMEFKEAIQLLWLNVVACSMLEFMITMAE